jgi:hypothetical protein
MRSQNKGASVVSAIAANRAAFFRLVEKLECEAGCRMDTIMLEATIDAEFPGRESLTQEEARRVMRQARKSKAPL